MAGLRPAFSALLSGTGVGGDVGAWGAGSKVPRRGDPPIRSTFAAMLPWLRKVVRLTVLSGTCTVNQHQESQTSHRILAQGLPDPTATGADEGSPALCRRRSPAHDIGRWGARTSRDSGSWHDGMCPRVRMDGRAPQFFAGFVRKHSMKLSTELMETDEHSVSVSP